MTTYSRGCSPQWTFVNTTGQQLDDTYYMFFLEPDLPYLPKNVYQNVAGTLARSNPVQFTAAGTMPINLYGAEGETYRLEVRQGPSQSDPLIWEWPNWVWPDTSGSGGGGGDTIDLLSENQLTNADFSTVYINEEFTYTSSGNYEIAPGWTLVLDGSGSLLVTYTAQTGADTTAQQPTPPYTLKFPAASGFQSIKLQQRLTGNGGIWSLGAAAFTGTFKAETGTNPIIVTYAPSAGVDTVIMSQPTVTGVFAVLKGAEEIPASQNSDPNDTAYVDIIIEIPTNDTITIGSFQLLGQEKPLETDFQQETIERQTDHMFNVYKDSILMMPKESLLTGWQFSQNPWQFSTTTSTTITDQTSYTADQTILHQKAGGSQVAAGRASATNLYGYQVTAVTNDNRFAIIQYIDPKTMRGYWGTNLSCLVKCRFDNGHVASTLSIKAKLIYRASLPPAISATEPIATWLDTPNPNTISLASGWLPLNPLGDPEYTLQKNNVDNTLEFRFNSPVNASADDMVMGILIYTTSNMDETSTADKVIFDSISLIPNDFAIETNVMTFDESLRRCQYYYEKSYELATQAGATTSIGMKRIIHQVYFGLPLTLFRKGEWAFDYCTVKRAPPTLTFYSPSAGTINRIDIGYSNGSTNSTGSPQLADIALWEPTPSPSDSTFRVSYRAVTAGDIGGFSISGTVSWFPYHQFHYTADARLGIA